MNTLLRGRCHPRLSPIQLLQVLRQCHAPLFTLLGKTSGRDVKKLELIEEAGQQLTESFGFTVLAGETSIRAQQADLRYHP